MRKLIVSCLCGFLVGGGLAHGEALEPQFKNIEDVRQHFAAHTAQFAKLTYKALQLRPADILPKNAIDLSECQVIRKKIELNYPVSPFSPDGTQGHAYNMLCGDESRVKKGIEVEAYFEPFQSVTSLGLSTKYAFLRFISGSKKIYHGLLLNDDLKMVGGFGFLLSKDGDLSSATKVFIWNIDKDGNYFSNMYSAKNSTEENSQQFFVKDGSYWGGRSYKKEAFGIRPGVEVLRQKKTTKKDWDEVHLLPTLMSENPFFQYGDTIISEATFTNELIEARSYRKELCVIGKIKRGTVEQTFSRGWANSCSIKF